ncbi:MAG: DUF4139 domain-containing protein [Anaerolineaceae bacterium]|nr:DUF4139 domain-containing protein [Anaerolineaceae bacterium]
MYATTRLKVIFVSFLLALLVVPAAFAQDNSSSSVSLTIYNQGTALVQDRRSFDLQSGSNTLDFTDVAATIDSTSVNFRSLTDPEGTQVLEQNYIYDLVGSGALLERYLDETINVTTDDGDQFTGQLLSGRGGEVILRHEDGQVFVIQLSKIRDLRFPALPDGLITRPTLRWLLNSAQTGSQQVELTYLAGGMNWSADYNVLLATDNAALDMTGWVTLTNTSGATFNDAQVKLVAGDVNRLPVPTDRGFYEDEFMLAAPAVGESNVAQRDFFEYQLYEINRPVTVADNETKQVEFVTAAGIPATTFYVYDGSGPFYGYYGPNTDPGYGITGITDVQNWLEFSTGDDGGLGADLPAGRIRVYQEDTDGSALLIGENQIDHTPKGEDIQIYLGNAFDLVGERKQTTFNILSRTVLEESYEIRIRNRKDSDTVQVRVPEHLFRWSNWAILNASADYTQLDSATIEFRVDVPPGGETVITYTVRYSWPG